SLAERPDRGLDLPPRIRQLFLVERLDVPDVAKRRHQQVAGVVGIPVHEDERALATVQDHGGLVVAPRDDVAEQAALLLAERTLDVRPPPGAPQALHGTG